MLVMPSSSAMAFTLTFRPPTFTARRKITQGMQGVSARNAPSYPPDMLRVFRDAVVIMTGGGSGLGAALSAELARRGAKVIVSDVRLDAAEKVAAEIGGTPAKLDVTDANAVRALVEGIHGEHGRLDYLVANAGIGCLGEAWRESIDDQRRVVEVNLFGVLHGFRAAYPLMMSQGFGHIVSVASVAGLVPVPWFATYGATKAAVYAWSRALRLEAERHGVRVSVVCPGAIRTPLLTGGAFGKVLVPEGTTSLAPERLLSWWARLGIEEPERFARRVIDGVAANRAVIIDPPRARRVLGLLRWFPWLERKMTEVDFRRTVATLPEIAQR